MVVSLEDQLNSQKRKVDFNTYDISIKEILNMIRENIIDIAPDYQRHFRWGKDKQSKLIESLYLGIPVPTIFAATNTDGTWEIIDGVQRLSSIVRFAGDHTTMEKINLDGSPLELSDLENLTTFNGKTYEMLPKAIQLQFLLAPLKVTTLTDKSDLNVRFDLFERLNTGGVILSNQEIRSCVFRGPFNDYIKELSFNEDFRQVSVLTDTQEKDGTREELVLRFFAYLYNYKNFDHSVITFLNDYMKSANVKFQYEKGAIIFDEVFKSLKDAFPSGISKKTRKNTPIILFEAVSVGAALSYMDTGKVNTRNVEKWLYSDELNAYTSGSTNQKSKVIARIEYCRDQFKR